MNSATPFLHGEMQRARNLVAQIIDPKSELGQEATLVIAYALQIVREEGMRSVMPLGVGS
jgi:hypothetical protein